MSQAPQRQRSAPHDPLLAWARAPAGASFYCGFCDVFFSDHRSAELHKTTQRHKAKSGELEQERKTYGNVDDAEVTAQDVLSLVKRVQQERATVSLRELRAAAVRRMGAATGGAEPASSVATPGATRSDGGDRAVADGAGMTDDPPPPPASPPREPSPGSTDHPVASAPPLAAAVEGSRGRGRGVGGLAAAVAAARHRQVAVHTEQPLGGSTGPKRMGAAGGWKEEKEIEEEDLHRGSVAP